MKIKVLGAEIFQTTSQGNDNDTILDFHSLLSSSTHQRERKEGKKGRKMCFP